MNQVKKLLDRMDRIKRIRIKGCFHGGAPRSVVVGGTFGITSKSSSFCSERGMVWDYKGTEMRIHLPVLPDSVFVGTIDALRHNSVAK